MISNNNLSQQNFGSHFSYYGGNKRVPQYVQRVVNAFTCRTVETPDLTLVYGGHSKTNFRFSLKGKGGETLSEGVFKFPTDFLAHKSFKFLPHRERSQKIADCAKQLTQVQENLLLRA